MKIEILYETQSWVPEKRRFAWVEEYLEDVEGKPVV